MSKRTVAYVLIALLFAPVNTFAAGKKAAGGILLAAGSGMIIGAFNYDPDQCPPGYTTHTFEGLPTQCVYVSSSGSDVREATTGITFERHGLMWAGVGAVGAGLVLMMLPKRTAKIVNAVGVSLSITPKGWMASKTIQIRREPKLAR